MVVMLVRSEFLFVVSNSINNQSVDHAVDHAVNHDNITGSVGPETYREGRETQ